ncbi:hypothetical protein C2E23DRAFT_719588 [Lenzites betulinus]|nr:hypothetical protein C2E23DRAFT_719588 [Lenzites betulinus]
MAAALPATHSDTTGDHVTDSSLLRRDSDFYCQDIVFRVEDVLFKVPRRPFEDDSEVFSNMFTLPPANHPSGIEGSSDHNPLLLQGVTAEEFKALLYVLFPTTYGGPRSLTKDQWMSAMKLADMWFFVAVRNQAIVELHRLISSHAERVQVARRLQIPGWVEPALMELAYQDVLSAADLQALGWATTAKLMQLRESIHFTNLCTCACNYCNHAHSRPQGSQPAAITAASLRRSMDFGARIREVFAADIF